MRIGLPQYLVAADGHLSGSVIPGPSRRSGLPVGPQLGEAEPQVELCAPVLPSSTPRCTPVAPAAVSPSSTDSTTRRPQPWPCSLGRRSTWRWAGCAASSPASAGVGWCSRSTRARVGRGRAAAERVALAQGREPDLLEPPLEGAGVGHAEAVAGHPVLVVQHPGDGVGEGEVGPGPEVAEQVGVVVQGARVAAAGAGEQADPVDPGQVVHRAGPHRRHPGHASAAPGIGRCRAAGRSVPGMSGWDEVIAAVGQAQQGLEGGREALLEQWAATTADDHAQRCVLAHYLADREPELADEVAWDEVALREHALVADDALAAIGIPSVRGMAPSLHLNLGDGYLRQGRVGEAQRAARGRAGGGRRAGRRRVRRDGEWRPRTAGGTAGPAADRPGRRDA